MKNKHVLLLLPILLLAASCSVPRGLPAPEELPYETKGAAFFVKLNDGSVYRGELIAAEKDVLYVLPMERQLPNIQTPNRLVQINLNAVDNYRVYYAHGKPLAKFVWLYTVMTLSHGWASILTMPLNLIVTLSVNFASQHEYVLRKKDITPEALGLFARFPQGIPANVSPADIY
jgi:hypothetical protein